MGNKGFARAAGLGLLTSLCLTAAALAGNWWIDNSTVKANSGRAVMVSPSAQFCNTTPIILTGPLSSGPGNPYPSRINVSGLTGVVANVNLTLTNIQHTWGRDIDVLLVSPDGRQFIPMSDPGQGDGFDNPATITLSDSGTALITNMSGPIASGTYRPTNHNDALALDSFNAPAPSGPYNSPAVTGSATFASIFNGADPNGEWLLYVMDDASTFSGAIGGGWCLDITTGPPQSGQFQFGLSGYDGNANGTATITVNRINGMAGAASVDYSTSGGTATGGAACSAGVDYVNATGTLNFANGETRKTFTVQLCPDSGNEPVETVNLTLSNPTNGALIAAPNPITLTISPQSAPAGTFCQALPIEISALGGTAGAADPYPSNVTVTGLTGTLRSVSLKLNGIRHDTAPEIDMLLVSPTGQRFIVMSDVGSGLSLRTAVDLNLTDFALAPLPLTSVEYASGDYRPTNAGPGDGFPAPAPTGPHENPAPAGLATFASVFAGFDPNGTWSLYVYDDFVGGRGQINNWCLTVATDNPQAPGQLQFGTTNFSGREGETANVTVTRSGGSLGAVTVNYATTNGTATGGAACGSGVDFIHSSGTLTFPDGVTSRVIPVQLCLDSPVDPDETFSVTLSNPTGGATIGTNNPASVRIVHVDETSLQLFSSRYTVREGKKQTVVLTRIFNQIGTASVDYATSNGSATGGAACTEGVDFIHTSGTVVFRPNAHVESFDITTCPDSVFEELEFANITLSNPVGARLDVPAAGRLNIFESIWQKQATFPTGQQLEQVHMVSATEGWAVGGFGLVIHTTDGGATWEQQTTGTYEALNSIYFLNSEIGWAAGNTYLYTTDGGDTWTQAFFTIPGIGTAYRLEFADENRGFAVGNNLTAIMRTVDGGRNWFRQDMPIRVGLVEFFDSQNGIASSSDGVLVTSDGGQTWTQRPNATGADEWLDTNRGWRINNSTVIGGVIRQRIDYTTNGGVTWTQGATPDGTFVWSLHFVDAMNGWGSGTKENIIRTTDGGVTWQTLRGGLNSAREFNAPLRDIFMFDTQRGLVVGNGGLTYSTTDGGAAWVRRQSGSGESTHKIVAIDNRHAWAAMEDGEIMKTTDGGRFWKRKKVYVGSSDADATIAGIAFPNLQNGWACIRGRIGTPGIPSVLKTTNSGEDWEDVNNAPAHNCWAIDTFDGQTIVSVGFEGGGAPIVRSTDGGQSWTYTVYPGSSVIRDVDMVSPTVGFMAAGSRILKSTDGFATWTTIQDGGNWFDVSFVDANNGWALGASPTNSLTELWHTTNGGQSWTQRQMPDAVAVHAVNAQTVWVLDHDGDPNPLGNPTFAERSIDGGQTFTRELVSLENASRTIFFVDAENGWVGGTSTLTPSNTVDGAEVFRRGTAGLGSPNRAPFDFDGDGKTDMSIFRPAGGEWWWNRSSSDTSTAFVFGNASDRLVAADFTGDGKADAAFWRPSSGEWFILRSEDSSFFAFPFGANGDVPVPADYDADGKADAAVFRPSTSTWYISRSSGGTDIFTFGAAGDRPVPADYDGDGKTDIAIYRPDGSNGAEWWVTNSSNGTVRALIFGAAGDRATAGDFTGDGKADIAFWRPSNGFWNILRSEDLSYYAFPFGANGDMPTPGDYDGDGRVDAAVFRPSSATWFSQGSTAGTIIRQYGSPGDVPIPNVFVR
jgi:photosystem II stability/assembly factor-like uncharacterized protein/subtilisin-like proprotein convertase family protein